LEKGLKKILAEGKICEMKWQTHAKGMQVSGKEMAPDDNLGRP